MHASSVICKSSGQQKRISGLLFLIFFNSPISFSSGRMCSIPNHINNAWLHVARGNMSVSVCVLECVY